MTGVSAADSAAVAVGADWEVAKPRPAHIAGLRKPVGGGARTEPSRNRRAANYWLSALRAGLPTHPDARNLPGCESQGAHILCNRAGRRCWVAPNRTAALIHSIHPSPDRHQRPHTGHGPRGEPADPPVGLARASGPKANG